MDEKHGCSDLALERLDLGIACYFNRDFFCHPRLELEKARAIGLTDSEAGLALAREVGTRVQDAEAVLLLNRSEELIRQLKRENAGSHSRADAAASEGLSALARVPPLTSDRSEGETVGTSRPLTRSTLKGKPC